MLTYIIWHPNESKGVFEASGWLKRRRLTACVTWATACPRRCFHPLSRGPCPCPLVKPSGHPGWRVVWCRAFLRVFSHTKNHKNHHWTHVYMIHLNWWPWGKWLGRIFCFQKCAWKSVHQNFMELVSSVRFLLLSGWRFEENWSCFLLFFFLVVFQCVEGRSLFRIKEIPSK